MTIRTWARALAPMLLASVWTAPGRSAPVTQAQTGASSRMKAFVGATLIDGMGKPPLPNAVIVVDGERIVEVRPDTPGRPLPPGIQTIPLRGKYIIPGLVDGHAHYRSWSGELYLNHGVTSVVDVGNVSEWMVALKNGIARGRITRVPRIYASGYALDGTAARATVNDAGIRLVRRLGTFQRLFNDPDAVRRHVTTSIEDEHLDLVSTFGRLSPALIKSAADEAHKHGKRVFGHVGDLENNVYDFVNAGGDCVTHLYSTVVQTLLPEDMEVFRKTELPTSFGRMDPGRVDALVAFLVAHHTYVTPLLVYEHEPFTDRTDQFRAETAQLLGRSELAYVPADGRLGMVSLYERVRSYGWRQGYFTYIDGLSPADLEYFRVGYRNAQTFVRKFVQAGGKVLVGTDASGGSVAPGLSVHQDMQLLVDSGLTPMQALAAATSIPAEAIGKSDEFGSVQPGRFADLVILDADPLQAIGNTRRIASVVQHGEIVELGYHWNYSLPIVNPVEDDFTSTAYIPEPRIEDVSPKLTTAGASGVTIAVTGLGFVNRSQVTFGGQALPTRFHTPNRLTADVPAALLAAAGTRAVRVVNPAPGGGTSNPLGFIVQFK